MNQESDDALVHSLTMDYGFVDILDQTVGNTSTVRTAIESRKHGYRSSLAASTHKLRSALDELVTPSGPASDIIVNISNIVETNSRNLTQFVVETDATDDVGRLLADPEIDLVVVASPDKLHAEHALAVIATGKHLFLEKPMATSVSDARPALRCGPIADVAPENMSVNTNSATITPRTHFTTFL